MSSSMIHNAPHFAALGALSLMLFSPILGYFTFLVATSLLNRTWLLQSCGDGADNTARFEGTATDGAQGPEAGTVEAGVP